MKYKCIGGELSGKIFDLQMPFRENETIKLSIYPKLLSHTIGPAEYIREKEAIIQYAYYKMISVTYHEDDNTNVFRFLTPIDWSRAKAIVHMFEQWTTDINVQNYNWMVKKYGHDFLTEMRLKDEAAIQKATNQSASPSSEKS